MTLPQFPLFEPIVSAMVTLLTNNLQGNITALNNTLSASDLANNYGVPAVQQIVPYTPVPSTLEVGGPVIGVWEMGGVFEDDLQTSVRANFEYAVVAVLQNADHIALMWQLRRIAQAIAYTVQQDRLLGASSVIRQAGAYSVNFMRVEPGPLLGDMDPNTPDAPPRSYLSWTGLVFSSRADEV